MLILEDKVILDQVERVLHSDELRDAEVLRRLLKFLAEKSVSGEADELKEYIVAIDGLGKPASYDPRHSSAVRIQVGRLRQKLADYYRTEGMDDPIVIDVPKGHFKLKCEQRPVPASLPNSNPALDGPSPAPFVPPAGHDTKRSGKGLAAIPFATLIWLGVVIATALGVYSWVKPWGARATNVSSLAGLSSPLEDLWGPFVVTKRPLIVVIEDPLFVVLHSDPDIHYRDKSLNSWQDVSKSSTIATLRSALHNPDIEQSHYFTTFGEAEVTFLIGKLLGPREQNVSLIKSSDLSWQQLADNNVLFVGRQNIFFDKQLLSLPIKPQLSQELGGIRNPHPEAGEPAFFSDQYAPAPTPSRPSRDGIAYALVTHLPGPLGTGDVESFTSSLGGGYLAAVKAFTDPGFAEGMVEKLRQAARGKMPRYYQVLLKIQLRDEVPTQTTCVLARELR
jgi:hypothetical protein